MCRDSSNRKARALLQIEMYYDPDTVDPRELATAMSAVVDAASREKEALTARGTSIGPVYASGNLAGKLVDPAGGPECRFRVDAAPNNDGLTSGLLITFAGYGCGQGETDSAVVYIDYRGGDPRIIVWGDINDEDPTHIIRLDKARLDNMKEAP